MLQVRAYLPTQRVESVEQQLATMPGVRHLIIGGRTTDGLIRIAAELDNDVADDALTLLRAEGLASDHIVMWRTASLEPLASRRTGDGHDSAVWAEITAHAAEHARTRTLYALFMAAAGLVAGVGVIQASSILVVGAMALSPDLLPISAAAVGLVEHRWRLAARAAATLGVGLAIAAATAAGATLLLRAFGRIDQDLAIATSVIGPSLTEINPGTVLVALTAGMAGILAYETSGGAAVGVAISVTTIPAVAYAGCALGLGDAAGGAGALSVLATNVACLMAASTATLLVQRRFRRRPGRTGFGRRPV
jgi:uncharacterized hydrophobic protein (TIGR00271 family)